MYALVLGPVQRNHRSGKVHPHRVAIIVVVRSFVRSFRVSVRRGFRKWICEFRMVVVFSLADDWLVGWLAGWWYGSWAIQLKS